MTPFIQFAEKNFKVKHPIKGVIPFEGHNFNINLAKIIDRERLVLVKKYRQAGLSTFFALWSLHACIHKEDQQIVITCRTDYDCLDLSQKLKTTVMNMPDDLRPEFQKLNAHEMWFKNGNRLFFRIPEACCGVACSILFFDEFAFWGKKDRPHFIAMWPTISTGGQFIIGSTPNRKNNYFYKLWTENNRFFRYAPWWGDHPDLLPERVAELKETVGEEGFRQEYESEFLD